MENGWLIFISKKTYKLYEHCEIAELRKLDCAKQSCTQAVKHFARNYFCANLHKMFFSRKRFANENPSIVPFFLQSFSKALYFPHWAMVTLIYA